MKALEEKILKEGSVLPGNILKVGSFLNQQIDPDFMFEIGEEIYRLYKDSGVTKILTIEASGIAIALAAARYFKVPALFAKKGKASNMSDDTLSVSVKSYTRNTVYDVSVSREYIDKGDRVLLVDDFLASGNALDGLIALSKMAGASVAGVAAVIEKGFQGGGDRLRSEGVRVESLAIVESMSDDSVVFRVQEP